MLAPRITNHFTLSNLGAALNIYGCVWKWLGYPDSPGMSIWWKTGWNGVLVCEEARIHTISFRGTPFISSVFIQKVNYEPKTFAWTARTMDCAMGKDETMVNISENHVPEIWTTCRDIICNHWCFICVPWHMIFDSYVYSIHFTLGYPHKRCLYVSVI